MVLMTAADFDATVAEALDTIPAELMAHLDNVVFLVEDESPAGQPEVLGVYEGVALTDRGEWGGMQLPDRITIFRGPLSRMCETREELVEEIGITVVHEVAHHFGIDDERLHELGWG